MKYVAALLVLIAATHAASRAHACSIALLELQEAPLPVSGTTTGPRPLLVTTATDAQLTDARGEVVAIISDLLLDEAISRGIPSFTSWRPAAPLPSGEYRWNGGAHEHTFFVDAELDAVAPVLTEVSFRVVRDRPGRSSGCDVDSCDDVDFTRAEVGFTSDAQFQRVMLELVDPASGQRRVTYGASGRLTPMSTETSFAHTVTVFDLNASLDLGATPICATLTPFGEDGVVGEPIDLGCSSGKNVDQDGCASTHATDAWLMLGALGLLALRRRGLA